MERIVRNNLIIDEIEVVEIRIAEVAATKICIEEMVEFINSESNTIFYFDKNQELKSADDKNICMAWMDTGYCDPKGNAIFISLKNYDGIFCGYFVGTAQFLINGMIARNGHATKTYRNNLNKFLKKYEQRIDSRTKKHLEVREKKEATILEEDKRHSMMPEILLDNTIAEENKSYVPQLEITDVTEEIYNNLLFPSWCTIQGLDRYIKIIGRRIEQLVSLDRDEYFVKNNIKSVVVNTGLMNIFGQDYLVCYRYNQKYKTYIAYKVMAGKTDYLENGFTKEQAIKILKPIQFQDRDNEVFEPTMDEFDINYSNLLHIIEDRRERFPANIQNEPADKMANYIMSALERGIRMQMRDHSYVKISYSGKTGQISWMMPLHINAKLTEEPELVMVICKCHEFYEIKTVLPYNEEIKDRITALSLYTKLW